jgi:hypothetical protein
VVVLPLLFLAPAQGISQPGDIPKSADQTASKNKAAKAEKPVKDNTKDQKQSPKVKNVPAGQSLSQAILVPTADAEEAKRPVVYRYGRLPKGLPDWFAQLDSDRDGQIGLFEWNRGHFPIELFQRLDLNDDGFITPEELLRHLACRGDRAAIFRLKVVPDDPPDDDDVDPDPS